MILKYVRRVYACLLGQGEAKTLGCLPGILRQVQGPPTTRRRLATGDLGDSSQRAAKLVNESAVQQRCQILSIGANRTVLALSPRAGNMHCRRIAVHKKLPSYVSLSIAMDIMIWMHSYSANANRFKVLPRSTCDLSSCLMTRAREQSNRGTVVF